MALSTFLANHPGPVFCIQAISAAGIPSHYTGRAGEGWLSYSVQDAFPFLTLEGAFRKVGIFTRQHRGNLIFNVIDARTGEYIEEA